MVQFLLLLLVEYGYAATYTPKKETGFRLSKVALDAKGIIQNIGLVFGIAMVLMGVQKYFEHRSNPLGQPVSRAVSLLLTGAALIGAYYLTVPDVKPF